jgi:DNA-binding protein
MLITLSDEMRHDIELMVRVKAHELRIIDVAGIAEQVRLRFLDQNVALEDIATVVAKVAVQSGCALELGEGALTIN